MDRFREWLLLSGNRPSVAAVILVVMTTVVLVPSNTGFAIQNTTPLFYVASTLIGGNVTLVTVVVAINQVILSQELESPGSLRDEIRQAADYQRKAIDEATPPSDPAEFLQLLLRQTGERARSLEGQASDSTDEATSRLLKDLPERCEQGSDELESASNDLSSVVVPVLSFDYSGYINDCYQLQSESGEERHDRRSTTLDELVQDLERLSVAQQYFTTAFMKEELATLSRYLVYIGVAAVSIPVALLYQLTTYPGASPPMPGLFALTVLTVVVGLSPLALLIAFILRVSTVTQYTAAIAPFNG